MTNKEASEWFKKRAQKAPMPGAREAFKLAAEALANADVPGKNVGDTISRQAAIDAILAVTNFNNVREMLDYVLENNLTNDWIGGVIDSIDAVIEVDSAQPEIIYCKDCVRNIGPEFGFCDRANHHVSLNSCCANVFHAERRDAE